MVDSDELLDPITVSSSILAGQGASAQALLLMARECQNLMHGLLCVPFSDVHVRSRAMSSREQVAQKPI